MSDTIKVYGLANCDRCSKALRHLREQTADVELIDVRSKPVGTTLLTAWCCQFGADALLNRRSTTWRTLTPAQQSVSTVAQTVALIRLYPTLMKRPVIVTPTASVLGFDAEAIRKLAP